MNILFCGDQQAADGFLITSLSLAEHISEPLHIYVMTMAITTSEKTFQPVNTATAQLIEQQIKLVNPDSRMTLIDAGDYFQAQPPVANLASRFTPFSMLRLYADQIPIIPDRILYLDNDIICRKPFNQFYYQDLTGIEMVGVLDHYGKWLFHHEHRVLDYLNSGVLLLNLAEIKQTGLFEKCRQYLATKTLFMPDQSALNILAQHKRIAPRRYNDQRRLHKNTVFQHFPTSFRFFPWVHTLTVKPWEVDRMHNQLHLHEYDQLLDQYQALIPQLKGAARVH